MTSVTKVSIYEYQDYRKYLRDYYIEQKSLSPAFTYRLFGKRAGISSLGFYKDVVDGRLTLGSKMIKKFITALGLTKEQAEYFEAMVGFSDSDTEEYRKIYFDRMLALQPANTHSIGIERYEYYSHWYNSAIRVLLLCSKHPSDAETLSRVLCPSISPTQAQVALETLLKLGLIRKTGAENYEAIDPVITSGKKMTASPGVMNIINYQKEMITLAQDAFHRHSTEELDMSTLTVAISDKMFQSIKKDLAALRQKVLAASVRDKNSERVYQLCMQLFPLTRNEIGREVNDP
jgi:uncharacterized protein (TIGR02147 family)